MTTTHKRIAKKPVAKKPAAKKPIAKKPAAKKPAAKKPAAKKPVAKKPVAKKPVAKKPVAKKPVAKASTTKKPSKGGTVDVGSRAPKFSLLDQSGRRVSSSDLSGAPYVLYFYPKDDTPGCTREACGFRDDLAAFERLGVRVLGVSPDSQASHERFAKKYGLNFTLLSDPERALAQSYGVYVLKKNYGREYMGIERSTFVVDRSGKVAAIWRSVKVDGHVTQVMEAATSLG
jgi:thioredoxin-dependent peroxiredoxin